MKRLRSIDMTKGSPLKVILLFSIPLLIGAVVEQLYNVVNGIIVGRYWNETQLAVLGVAGTVVSLESLLAVGLTSGFSVIVSQKVGAKDEDGIRRSIASSLVLSGALALLSTLLLVVAARPLLVLLNTPEELLEEAFQYTVVMFIGTATTFLYNLWIYLLRAMGDSVIPFCYLVAVSAVNCIVDFLGIGLFGMGVVETAWLRAGVKLFFGIACYFHIKSKYPVLQLKRKDFQPDKSLMKSQLSLGLNMSLQQVIVTIGSFVMQYAVNQLSTEQIVGYNAAGRVLSPCLQPCVAFGLVVANYTGQNLGANRIDRVKEGVKVSLRIVLSICVVVVLVLWLLGEPAMKLFLPNASAEVLHGGAQGLKVYAVFFVFVSVLQVHRNALYGLGRGFMPFLSGFFEVGARSATALLLPGIIGYLGIYFVNPAAWTAAAVPLAVTYYVILRKIEEKGNFV